MSRVWIEKQKIDSYVKLSVYHGRKLKAILRVDKIPYSLIAKGFLRLKWHVNYHYVAVWSDTISLQSVFIDEE